LGNLAHVENWAEYRVASAGFWFDFQLINVEDFNGVGESEPSPYFYQNLAEAEYCAAVFMYMRLIGYPADKISVLTTYRVRQASSLFHMDRSVQKRKLFVMSSIFAHIK
jgi:intron-binding protein aquarius